MADAPSFVAGGPPAASQPATNGSATTPAAEEGIKVFAGNLAYATDDEALKAFFSSAANGADVLSAQVIHRGTRSAGYGFVAFSTLEAAQTAVTALNQKELDGRAVIVEIAKAPEEKVKRPKQPKKRVPRRGSKAATGEVTEADAAGEGAASPAAEGTEGEKPKKKKKKPARKPKAEGEGAQAETNGEAVKKSRQPRPKRPAGEDPVGEPSKTMVFVANLGFNVDDTQLAELFTSNGLNVTSAHVVKRRWGKPRKSKGYGFVDVGSEEEQKKAIDTLQGKEIDGRQIAVKVAVNASHEDSDNGAQASQPAPPANATPAA